MSELENIVESVSNDLGGSLDARSVQPIDRPAGKEQVKDATFAYMIKGAHSRDDVALLLSNPSFPNCVAEDVERANIIRHLVEADVSKHIVQPVSTGMDGQQTYAAFRRLSPISENRLVRYIQKKTVSPKVAEWLTRLAIQTRSAPENPEEYSELFEKPLQFLIDYPDTPPQLADFSRQCVEHISNSQIDLFTTVEHGDFWIGNVLFERTNVPILSGIKDDFTVIDWRGARQDGYPCIDLVRFCNSIFRHGSASTDTLIKAYRKSLGISAGEVGLYCALGLGRLGINIDQFPPERYRALSNDIFDFLSAHRLTSLN